MKRIVAALFAVSVMAANAQAADLSAMSGLYQSSKVKNGNENATMSLGVRYQADVVDNKAWFADVNFSNSTTKVPSPAKSPDPSTAYTLGGGLVWTMKALAGDNFTPYVTFGGHLEGGKRYNAAGNIVETTGVSYGSDVGVRVDTSDKCFFIMETNLFTSYLTKTEKEKLAAGGTVETTTMELFGDTTGAFAAMRIGVGMKI